MDSKTIGLALVAAGLLAVAVGLGMAFGLLGWFGRLPGDIRVERESVKIYVPLASMLIVSVALSVALALARRLF